jgi:hypothetical protein
MIMIKYSRVFVSKNLNHDLEKPHHANAMIKITTLQTYKI